MCRANMRADGNVEESINRELSEFAQLVERVRSEDPSLTTLKPNPGHFSDEGVISLAEALETNTIITDLV